MERYLKGIVVSLFAIFTSSFVQAQDSYNEKDWSDYKILSTKGNLKNNKYNGFYYVHAVDQISGKWLRVSASSDLNADDFTISLMPSTANLQGFNNEYFPTVCNPVDEKKVCSNLIWLAPRTTNIGITFSWPKKSLVTPENIHYQIAEASPATTDNEIRYKNWINLLKEQYYRTKEVDWEKAYIAGFNTLSSPSGIDPLPRALWEVINQLPEHSQTHILLVDTKKNKTLEAKIYPTCIQIDDSTWRLDLPSTSTAIGNKWYLSNTNEYISRAHECLAQQGATKWIVNLTELKSGSTMTAIASLAPLLKEGPVLQSKNSRGEITSIAINKLNITIDNKNQLQWKTPLPAYKGTTDFIVDKQCGNTICAAIAIAAKGHGRLLGQELPTLSSSNDLIKINNEMELQLTTHFLIDAKGNPYTQIQPDLIVDEHSIEKALLGELK